MCVNHHILFAPVYHVHTYHTLEEIWIITMSMEKKEDKIQGLLSAARTSSARSIFLAGFSFTRLRIYATAPYDDSAFIVLMCLCFNLALLSAAFSLLFIFFLELCPTPIQQLHFANLSSKTLVVPSYACFILALITFCLGLSRIGFANFADSSYKYAPFVIFLVTVVLIIRTQFFMTSLLREQLTDAPSDEKRSSVDNPEPLTSSAIKTKQLQINRSGEKLETFLMKQIGVLAERAIFIAGFAVNGISFYVDSSDKQNWYDLDKVYLISACLSAACALFVCGCLSSGGVLLEQASPADGRRVLFANQIYPLCAACLLVYTLAFWALSVAVVFVGWGHAYTQDKGVCVAIGVGGIIAMQVVFFWVVRCHGQLTSSAPADSPPLSRKEANHASSIRNSSKSDMEGGQTEAESVKSPVTDDEADREGKDKDMVTLTLQKNAKVGGIAVITSGFVFITMLFYGNYASTTRHTLNAAYLAANCFSVVLCLVIAISDSLVQLFSNDLSTFRQRRLFLDKMQPVFIATRIGGVLAFGMMIVSFSLVGLVRFQPDSYEPLFAGSLTGLLLIGGMTFLYVSYNSIGDILKKFTAQQQQQGEGVNGTEANGDKSTSQQVPPPTPMLDPLLVHRVPRRPLQLSLMGGCALFFGGYAYNTVINMNFQRTKIDISFVSVMSLVFLCSIVVTAWSTMYVIGVLSCPTPKEKFIFTMRTGPFYNTGIGLSLLSMVAVTVGFSLLGYTKTTTDHYKTFSLILIGATVLGICLVALILYRIVRLYVDNVYPITQKQQQAVEQGTLPTPDHSVFKEEYRPRLITQISAATVASAFVGGNILYELLFVNAIFGRFPDVVNYIFFVLAACTFVSATSVVVLSNITLFWVNSLPDEESERLCYHLYHSQINWCIFYFSTSAILTWIGSVGFQPHATYLHSIDQRWPNSAICMMSLLIVAMALRRAFKNVETACVPVAEEGVVLTPLSSAQESTVA